MTDRVVGFTKFCARLRELFSVLRLALPIVGAAVVVGLATAPVLARQTTVTLTATADNTLYSESGTTSNGAGTFMFTGRTNNGTLRRSLVRFDLTTIPAGSTINSVTLTLTMSRSNNNTGQATTLNRMLANWGQGTSDATQAGEGQGAAATTNDATWTFRLFNTASWTTAGGDFNATASATTTVGAPGTYTWTSATMLSDVQGWFANSATNFGWIVRGNEATNASAKRFNTREFATAAQRPILTVVYTPIAPATGACCISGVCSTVSAAACATAGGTYQGDNTLCSPNPCPQPTGACCIAGVCSILTSANCTAQTGSYQGDNTSCSPNPCTAGTTVTLAASKDNTLYETPPNAVTSNGAGIGFVVGRAGGANLRRRGLIAFNLSAIPSNATITDARLRLFMGFNGDTAARVVNVHRTLADWGEGTSDAGGTETVGAAPTTNDATWVHRFFNTPTWTVAGGQFNATASASTTIPTTNGFFDWTGAALTSDVQAWVTNSASNFGWTLVGNEAVNNTQRRFESRTNGTAANRPQLSVTYTVPPATGACCSNGSCSVLTPAQCTATGGSYQGNGTTCTPNPCPQPTGACCLPSGLCSILASAQCSTQSGTYHGDNTTCASVSCPVILTPFVDALPIPAVAQPISGVAGGAATYSIGMTEFTQQLHRDLPPTRVWGYNGTYPGPTIEARRNLPVDVTWVNNLRDSTGALRTTHLLPVDLCLHGPNVSGDVPVTVVHLHGAHVAPAGDGDPDLAFGPGQSSPVYHYPNDQNASTYWYHDHALGLTRLNVYMGLAGFYLIREAAEDALNLPRGEYEIPLVIQDRSFSPDGSLSYNAQLEDHFFGKFILVNGKVWPFLNVKQGKYRFRIVNGANTRFFTLSLSNGATFQQIGTDDGLLSAPVTLSSLTIANGERADIVIDFASYAPGTQITLSNSAPAPFPLGEPENDIANVMRFHVVGQPGSTNPIPATLIPVSPIPESESVTARTFSLRSVFETNCNHDMWLINDLMWDDITDFPRVGTTEVWSFINRSNFTHPMHVHLVAFQILDRQAVTIVNDQPVPTGPRIPPDANEAGWKDTVQVHPFQITRVIQRYEGFYGRYPMHCHILEHEDHEMMRQFEVLCDPPTITTPPLRTTGAIGGSASFTVSAAGDALKAQWRHAGVPLADGPNAQGSVVAGSSSTTLSISNIHASDFGPYDCIITNPCGTVTTTAVALGNACIADMDDGSGSGVSDGGVGIEDLLYYLSVYDSGSSRADVDDGTGSGHPDGGVGIEDLLYYLSRYDIGC